MIKGFFTRDPSWFDCQLSDTYGGQEIKMNPGYEMQELITWWREWKDIMRSQHPSVQDAIKQVKVVHTLTKQEAEH